MAIGVETALAQKAGGQAVDLGRGRRRSVRRHQRHAELVGERGQYVAHGDEAEVDQDLAQLVAALLLQFERALQVLFRDLATLDQHLAQAHVAAHGPGVDLLLRTGH